MTRPCRLSCPSSAITDGELNTSTTPGDDSSNAYAVSSRMQEACSSLRFHVDNSVWDVIHQEVMNWRDSSWTSMNLPGNKTSFTLCLPAWDAQQPTGLSNDDDPLRKRVVAQMISVQLLASCFTPPQSMNTLTLPSSWYHKKYQADDNWLNTRLVSSLRQHTQWTYSPAFGHQARNNSAASLLPDRDDALSREALLAEQVSINRRLRQMKDGATKESADTKRRRQNEVPGDEPKRGRFLRSRLRHRLRKSEKSASSQRVLQGLLSPPPEALSPRGRVEQKNVLIVRSLQVRKLSNNGHRRFLEPVLRYENHPVFVQPVKDYVMRRVRVFSSRSHKQSSVSASSQGIANRPYYQRAASSASKDSIRLGGRNHIMTMNQGSGTSLGEPDSDVEAWSSARAGREGTLASAEGPQDFAKNAQGTAGSEPLIVMERSEGALPMESSTVYFPSKNYVPRHSLQSSESDQTTNRMSTSRTTVYNPPLIAEASPNSKRLESDGSTYSGTSNGVKDPKFLHEREIVNASE